VNEELTEVERNVFIFIRDFIRINEMPPTAHDIAKGMTLAPSNVYARLRMLDAKGYIARKPKLARGIALRKQLPGE